MEIENVCIKDSCSPCPFRRRREKGKPFWSCAKRIPCEWVVYQPRGEGMRKLKSSECAILHLTLRGIWYGMILHGDKHEEYRDYKPYWKSRISNWVNHQKEGWDNISNNKWLVIGFSHGYKKPDMFFLLHRHEVREGAVHPEWGEPRAPHFVLVLGERVTIVDDESEEVHGEQKQLR